MLNSNKFFKKNLEKGISGEIDDKTLKKCKKDLDAEKEYVEALKKAWKSAFLNKEIVIKQLKNEIDILKNKKGKNRLTEFRNLVKNDVYCIKGNYGCGAPVPKIKSDKKYFIGEPIF